MRLLEEHPERVGYLLKERVFDVAILVDALRRIADGETVIDPTIVSRLLGRRRRHDPLDELTAREREVLGAGRRRAARTARSRRGCSSPSGPSRRTSRRSSSSSAARVARAHRRVLAVLAFLRGPLVPASRNFVAAPSCGRPRWRGSLRCDRPPMTNRSPIVLAALAVATLSAAGCGGSGRPDKAGGEATPITLRLGTPDRAGSQARIRSRTSPTMSGAARTDRSGSSSHTTLRATALDGISAWPGWSATASSISGRCLPVPGMSGVRACGRSRRLPVADDGAGPARRRRRAAPIHDARRPSATGHHQAWL